MSTSLDAVNSLERPSEYARPSYVNLHKVLAKFGCQICKDSLLNPVQTSCGNRVCQQCILEKFGSEELISCPLRHDDEDASDTEGLECKTGLRRQDIHNDPGTRRAMSREKVFCTNKTLGCTEQMEWRKLSEHVESCEFKPVDCPNKSNGCIEPVAAKSVTQHCLTCLFSLIACVFCSVQYFRKDELKHLEDCPSAPAKCERCKQELGNRFQLKIHKQIKCFDGKLPCFYCKTGQFDSEEMEEHHKISKQQHLEWVAMEFEDFQRGMQQAKTVVTSASNASTVEKYKKKHRQLEMFLANINSTVDDLRTRLDSSGSARPSDPTINNSIEPLRRRVDVLERRLPSINESESLSQQARDISQLNIRLAELDVRLRRAATTVTPGAGFSGVLSWKIAEYARKKQDAIAGRNISLYSPPFYSGEAGYKMCGRIYLNGDGIGKGKCLSLFFVVMKGDFDDLLEWPFVWKVTFSILCPGNPGFDYSETFAPDRDSSSFRKPITDMNIASGCPEFKLQSEVENKYLKNDTLFVRIKVHNPLHTD